MQGAQYAVQHAVQSVGLHLPQKKYHGECHLQQDENTTDHYASAFLMCFDWWLLQTEYRYVLVRSGAPCVACLCSKQHPRCNCSYSMQRLCS
jgi:hypothetical protein